LNGSAVACGWNATAQDGEGVAGFADFVNQYVWIWRLAESLHHDLNPRAL